MPDAIDSRRSLEAALAEAAEHRAKGRREGAIRALRRATQLAPDAAPAWRALGIELGDIDRHTEALAALQRAVALAPGNAEYLNDEGNALQSLGRHAQALAAYRRAAIAAPGALAPHINMGDSHRALGDDAAAAGCYEAALALDPNSGTARYQLACLALAADDAAGALAQIDSCLAAAPYTPDALALRAVALAMLGRHSEVRQLLDFERLIQVRELPPPPGYRTARQFNRALEQHVLERSRLTPDPFGASTRGGRHSDDLMAGAGGPAAALKAALQRAFTDYIDALPHVPDHPFIAARPGAVQLVAQANVLDTGGFLVNHVHPQAWVSGAYYVRIPREIDANDRQRRGWLQFGGLPDEIRAPAPVEPYAVRPKDGLLVLFPSYFYHGTRPYQGKKHRMSLGIDVIPVPV